MPHFGWATCQGRLGAGLLKRPQSSNGLHFFFPGPWGLFFFRALGAFFFRALGAFFFPGPWGLGFGICGNKSGLWPGGCRNLKGVQCLSSKPIGRESTILCHTGLGMAHTAVSRQSPVLIPNVALISSIFTVGHITIIDHFVLV